jgi:hypothetical protein
MNFLISTKNIIPIEIHYFAALKKSNEKQKLFIQHTCELLKNKL